MLEITPAKQCKDGWYMNQGNSRKAKMCRHLASTEKGRIEIGGLKGIYPSIFGMLFATFLFVL